MNNISELKIPEFRFPGFSEEWVEKRLEEVAKISSGGTPSRGNSFYWNGNIPWVSTSLINFNTISDTDEYITEEGLRNSSAKLFPIGTVLMAMYGQGKTRGKVALLGIESTTNQACAAIIPKFKTLNEKFLYQNLFGRYDEIRNLSNQGGQENLSGELIKSLSINLPSFPEQQKIATFFIAFDEKLQSLKKKKTLLEQYKIGVVRKIFSQEFRFKDEDGNQFPDWEVKVLGAVSLIIMGQSPESTSYNSEGFGKLLIQGNADISNKKTNPRNWTSEPTKECVIGDIILTVRAPVGAVAKSIHNACIGRGVCAIRNKSISNIEFLYQFLLDYEPKWIRLEQGSTFTAVSGTDIKSIDINIPSLPEQIKIANFLSAIDEKINFITTQIEKTEQYKKGLLQKMFV